MPLVDPPYPSFTRVVTKMYSPPSPLLDSSRLPSYRAAHVGRFHPYPRGPRRNTEALYTPTVEYSTSLETIAEEPEAIVLRRLTVYYDEDSYSIDSVLSVKLGGPVVGDWCAALEPKARAKPVTMLADALKSMLRRTRHTLLALRVFHAGDEE